jgi:hypothetical protein
MPNANPQAPVDEQSVFLNVPFDKEYSPLFLALIAGLTALGRSPRCVLEVPSGGLNRLDRIFGLVANCGASIHDLSRVTLSGDLNLPRFNMPFELGMAYALSKVGPHSFFLLEEQPYRLQISLSDLNGHDPQIHDGTQSGVLRCVLNCFGTPSGVPDIATLETLTRRLTQLSSKLQRQVKAADVFHPFLFRRIALTAAELAKRQSLIR